MKKEKFNNSIVINNRKASYEYYLEDRYVAGLMLKGAEVKSIRLGKVNIQNSYCLFLKNELWMRGVHISPYHMDLSGSIVADRERKLLLSKKELNKINKKIEEKGLTIIATKLFINKNGWVKVEIAIAKGKKLYDKRQVLKEKDNKKRLKIYK